MSTGKPSIGFVGLGAMGFGMATHLVKHGYPVKGYDVFAKSVERFKEAGGSPASSLMETAEGMQYHICMVATAVQAQEVLFDKEKGLVKALPKGATLFLCSTVPSTYAKSAQDQLKEIGRGDIYFIDCPVSGGAARAAAGTLSIMAGAPPDAMKKGQFLLEEMADQEKLFIVPGGIGAGSNMKMVHQVLACVHILASSESMGFAAKLGLDAKEVREKVIASDSWSWMFENRTPRMLTEDYNPGVSALTIILKDTGIITTTSRLHSVPTPLCSLAEQQYVAGLSRGFAQDDDAGMVRMYYPDPITGVKKVETKKPMDNDPLGTTSGESPASMDLVLRLLKTIYILSCAEAIGLVHSLDVDVDTFYRLATDAAGGSRMLEKYARPMHSFLNGSQKATTEDGTVADLIKDMELVLKEARRVECPLYLGSQVLSLLLLAQRRGFGSAGPASIVCLWSGGAHLWTGGH